MDFIIIYQNIDDMDIFYNFTDYYTKDIDLINYNNNTYLKENYIKILLTHILLLIFNNIIQFCIESDKQEEIIIYSIRYNYKYNSR